MGRFNSVLCIVLFAACLSGLHGCVHIKLEDDAKRFVGQPVQVAYDEWGPAMVVEEHSSADGPYRAFSWRWEELQGRDYVHHVDTDAATYTQTTYIAEETWVVYCQMVLYTDMNNKVFNYRMLNNQGLYGPFGKACPTGEHTGIPHGDKWYSLP